MAQSGPDEREKQTGNPPATKSDAEKKPSGDSSSRRAARPKPLLDDIPKVRLRDGGGSNKGRTPARVPDEETKSLRPKSAATGDQAKEKAEPLRAETGEDLGAKPAPDRLLIVEAEMHEVEQAIRRQDLSKETQETQREIVQKLSLLIEQLEKQRPSSSRSSAKSSAPAAEPEASVSAKERATDQPTDSKEQGTADRQATSEALQVGMSKEVWGQLPAKIRQQMQSLKSEQFLPKYERMIHEYYKRLSEMDRPGTGR